MPRPNKGKTETIKKRAEELQAPFFGVFERRGSYIVKKTVKGHSFLFQTKKEKYNFSPSLQGEYQGKNAAVAIAASEQLSKDWKKLEKKKIIEGIETTKWEGRLELVSRNPLIILDGAHNIEGANALKKYIKDFLPSKLILVFAIKRDKEITKIAKILFPLAEKIIITRFPYFKAASPEDIKAKAQGFQDRLLLEPDVNQAMDLALRCAGSDGCVLAAGSLFLVGEIKKQMGSRLNI